MRLDYRARVHLGHDRIGSLGWIRRLRDADLLTTADLEALEAEVAAEVEDATAYAEEGTWEPIEDLLHDVYAPRPTRPPEPEAP